MNKILGYLKNQKGTFFIPIMVLFLTGWIGVVTTYWIDTQNELDQLKEQRQECCQECYVDQNMCQNLIVLDPERGTHNGKP